MICREAVIFLRQNSSWYLFTDSEKPPLTPLCIEDAERVEDPILFERPCKCIEDARSLVLRLDLAKCLAEEL